MFGETLRLWILKISKLSNLFKKLQYVWSCSLTRISSLAVRRKIFFDLGEVRSRKAESEQQANKVSLARYVGMFCHDCSYNVKFIFTNI